MYHINFHKLERPENVPLPIIGIFSSGNFPQKENHFIKTNKTFVKTELLPQSKTIEPIGKQIDITV